MTYKIQFNLIRESRIIYYNTHFVEHNTVMAAMHAEYMSQLYLCHHPCGRQTGRSREVSNASCGLVIRTSLHAEIVHLYLGTCTRIRSMKRKKPTPRHPDIGPSVREDDHMTLPRIPPNFRLLMAPKEFQQCTYPDNEALFRVLGAQRDNSLRRIRMERSQGFCKGWLVRPSFQLKKRGGRQRTVCAWALPTNFPVSTRKRDSCL